MKASTLRGRGGKTRLNRCSKGRKDPLSLHRCRRPKGIAESGVIQADTKGRVFLTDQRLSPAEVKDRLFIGRSGDKGSHVVEIQAAEGLAIRQGKNVNELIHQGTIRDGWQGTLTVKPNE